MTTTLSALQSGSVPRLAFVAAIDGYDHLLTNAPESYVQAAWADTDWATASVIPNLIVELDNAQVINPWDPLQTGGRLTLKVQPDETDRFGIDVHRTDNGAETMLTATCDRDDTYVAVESTEAFSERTIHIGTECMTYRMASGNGFLVIPGLTVGSSKRGKYTAFTGYNQTGFAETHRVTTADNGVRLAPIVSEQPRTWRGRRVSLWMHIYDTPTSINSKADALCVFVGDISEITDDSETGRTQVLVEHVLDSIKNAVIGSDFWQGRLKGGHYIAAGARFKFRDYDAATYKTANDLVVVASGASGTNQINAGTYAVEEIASFINAWLAGEKVAARVHGNYTLASPEDVNGAPRTVMHFYIPASSSNTVVNWKLTWPFNGWAKCLGRPNEGEWNVSDSGSSGHVNYGTGSPQPITVLWFGTGLTATAYAESDLGTFQDQYTTLPAAAKAIADAYGGSTRPWGIFLVEIDDPVLCVASFANGLLSYLFPIDNPAVPGSGAGSLQKLIDFEVKIGEEPPRIRQIFMHEGTFKDVYAWLFYSTGTPGYNHPTYDVLPPKHALAIPHGILGSNFIDSLALLPRATDTILVCLEKPKRLSEIASADLVLRRAHLIWREGGLRWAHWQSPSSDISVGTLTENTKAESAGVKAAHRAASVLDGTWVRNVVKLQYDRDITKIAEGGGSTYRSPPLVLEDATSVDDAGGKAVPFTLDCVNVYSEYDGNGQGVQSLAAGFVSFMPFSTRPQWKVHRSIDLRYYEGFGVGDVVLVDDEFVRDPRTGVRGIVARPGLIIRHRYQINSASQAGEKMRFAGEVDVMFLGSDRTFAYSPAAEWNGLLDDVFGFFCHAHSHSETGEPVDVASFAAGDKIYAVEVDPADTSDPGLVGPLTIASVNTVDSLITAVEDITSYGDWNASKRWRLIPARYSETQTSQRAKAFQAGSNGKVYTGVYPMQYGAGGSWTFEGGVHTPKNFTHHDVPDLPSTFSYGPNVGAPRDTGYDKEVCILLENLMDHKTNRSSPFLDPNGRQATNATGYELLFIYPIFLGDMIHSNSVDRWLYVRPLWKASAGGDPIASLRVTLTGRMPIGNSRNNVTIGAPATSNTWYKFKTETSYEIAGEMAFPLLNMNYHQYAFLLIEGSYLASCRGLAMVSERERRYT